MSTKATTRQIATAVNELLNSKLPADKIAQIVAAYLVSERRTKELDSLMRKLLELRAQSGSYEAEVTSAFELSDQIRRELEQIIKATHKNARQVIMNSQRDQSLLGGVRLETPDIQLDLTLRAKLRHLSQLTTNGA